MGKLSRHIEGPPLTSADIANNPSALVADLTAKPTVHESIQAARLTVRQEVQTHFREFYRRGPTGGEYRSSKATAERFMDALGQPVIPLMPIYTAEGAVANLKDKPRPPGGIVSKILDTAESWAQDGRSKGFQNPDAELAFLFIQRYRPFWTARPACGTWIMAWRPAATSAVPSAPRQPGSSNGQIPKCAWPMVYRNARRICPGWLQSAVNAERGSRDLSFDYYGLGIPEKHLHSMLESPSRYIGHTICLELLIGKDPELLPLIMGINQNPTEGLPEYRARINALHPGLYDKLTAPDMRDHNQGVTAARNVINLLYDGNMYAPVQNDGTDMLKDYFSAALLRTHTAGAKPTPC